MGVGSTRVNRWLRGAALEPDASDALCNYLGLDGWDRLGPSEPWRTSSGSRRRGR
jgi:hypothetical protein